MLVVVVVTVVVGIVHLVIIKIRRFSNLRANDISENVGSDELISAQRERERETGFVLFD